MRLLCSGCGNPPDDEPSGDWRAYYYEDVETHEPGVAIYCPECAEREFGRNESPGVFEYPE